MSKIIPKDFRLFMDGDSLMMEWSGSRYDIPASIEFGFIGATDGESAAARGRRRMEGMMRMKWMITYTIETEAETLDEAFRLTREYLASPANKLVVEQVSPLIGIAYVSEEQANAPIQPSDLDRAMAAGRNALLPISAKTKEAWLDSLETGPAVVMKIFEGVTPAKTTDADSGPALATLSAPPNFMNAELDGRWQPPPADASGIAGHYRIYSPDGTVAAQGLVSEERGGGDLEVSTIKFIAGRHFTIIAFTLKSF